MRLVTEILDDDISCVDKVLVNKPNSLFHLFFFKNKIFVGQLEYFQFDG